MSKLDINVPFASQDDVVTAMRDSRYKTSESYQSDVHAKLALMGDGLGDHDLEKAMSDGQHVQLWSDPNGEIAKDTSVFHSTDEVAKAMVDKRYRDDPWYRAQVEAKVNRSVPDEATQPQRANGWVEVPSDPNDERWNEMSKELLLEEGNGDRA